MQVVTAIIHKQRILVEDAGIEARSVVGELAGLHQAMVEQIGGIVLLRRQSRTKLLLLSTVHNAVVHLPMERELVMFAILIHIVGNEQRRSGARRLPPIIAQGAMPQQIVATLCDSNGILPAVVDDHIVGLDGIKHGINAHARQVLNNGVINAQSSLRRMDERLGLDAYKTIPDDGVVDEMVSIGTGIHQPDTVPLSRLVLEERLQTVALNHHGILRRAFDNELPVAPRPDATSIMHIDLRALVDMKGAVGINQSITIDHVGQFIGPMHRLETVSDDLELRITCNNTVGHDVTRILSVCHQLDHLGVPVGDEHDAVLHNKRSVHIGRVDGDLQEGKEAVAGRNDLILKHRARLTVEVELEPRLFASHQTDLTDAEVFFIRVVNLQLMRRRAQGGEHRVEHHRINRKRQAMTGIGADGVLLATGGKQGQKKQYEDAVSFHYSKFGTKLAIFIHFAYY